MVWGGGADLASHRHIHRAFFQNARKLGVPAVWVEDKPENAHVVTPDSVVIGIDIWGQFLPYVDGAKYCLHNFDGSHHLYEQIPDGDFLRLQVWTKDAYGENWDTCRQFDRDGKVLFQPWGTDLLAEEFPDPVFSGDSRNVTFVGAIWSEKHEGTDLGNEAVIQELRDACAEYGLSFRHLTHVSDDENVAATREARLAPSFVGGWQNQHGYLPCRAFKLPSYGALMFTNSDAVNHLFGDATVSGYTVSEALGAALALRRGEYLDLVREQQRIAARYSYRESLQSIDRALQEISG